MTRETIAFPTLKFFQRGKDFIAPLYPDTTTVQISESSDIKKECNGVDRFSLGKYIFSLEFIHKIVQSFRVSLVLQCADDVWSTLSHHPGHENKKTNVKIMMRSFVYFF